MDDGSTDGSAEIIRRFDRRIRWEIAPHRGGNATRNRLLELAEGEWLQYLDADDYLRPDKISKQVEFLYQHRGIDVVFGPVTLEHWSDTTVTREELSIPQPEDAWVLLARWFLPQTGAALWRRQAVADVGGWSPQQPCCQEHELYLRLLMAGKQLAYGASGGAVYRQWSPQTVCRRDPRQTRHRRLEIEERTETFLRDHGELTPLRLWAINQARFETARSAWQENRREARKIVEEIRRSQADFVPSGAAAPPRYQRLYRLLGFAATELLADTRRRIFPDA